MRSKYAVINILTGVIGQLLLIILNFVSRTVFIKILGSEYAGINGLFTNVISVLNITELGLGTAIIYNMYRPLAYKDINKIKANMNFLKRSYLFVGLLVLIIGLIIIPFLPYIINYDNLTTNINLIYILYLIQTVLSYWCLSYKSAILQADQKRYIISIFTTLIRVLTIFLQITILLIAKSFIVYLIIGIISQLILNAMIAYKVNKIYPYLKENNQLSLTKQEMQEVKKNIIGLSMYKVSGTVLNSTDNIIISSFIGLAQVGIYSNYLLILTSIKGLTQIIFNSFTASIGNLNVTESASKNEFIFRCLNFLNFWIYGFCSISLYILFNPFITLWVGKEYLLSKIVVILIVFNFLTEGLQQAVILYKDACGLFWIGRYRPILSSTLNTIFSVLLVKPLGISGVLLGTIISRFLTTWWFDATMVHKHVFGISPINYFIRYIRSLLIVLVVAILTEFFCSVLPDEYWLSFIGKCLLCVLIPNTIFILIFRKKEEFIYILNSIQKNVSKKVQHQKVNSSIKKRKITF